jgi:hypothetical protein
VFGVLVAWAFVVGGLIMAVACALNLLGLAPRWLRTAPLGRIQTLGLGMVGAGLAGFLWFFPADDAPVEAWREYWLGVGALGLVLFGAPDIWHWLRQGVRTDGALFLRVYTDRRDWRPKHLVLMGTLAASLLLPSLMPDNWWQLVAWVPFVAVAQSLGSLPIHRGRRPPIALGSAPQP